MFKCYRNLPVGSHQGTVALGSISNLILENQEIRDHIVAAALLTELIHTVDGRNPAPPWMVENL